MQHHEIADQIGLSIMDLESLLKGEATANVAKKLGVSMMDVQEFVRGKATFAMTQRLGLKTMNAAQELAQTAGGAGVLIGYMLNM
jgi:hypothetical protein